MNPQPSTPNSPPSPGQRLKAARLERQLSIEDITTATKMRPSIILALEADDFAGFPSITHARNFLSLYGKYLAIDIQDGLANLAIPARMGIENYQYLNVERHEDTSYRTPRRALASGGSRQGDSTTRSPLFIVGIVAFLFIAAYLSVNLRRLNLASTPSSGEINPTQAEDSPTGLDDTPASPRPSPSPTPEPDSAPYFAPIFDDRSHTPTRPWPRF